MSELEESKMGRREFLKRAGRRAVEAGAVLALTQLPSGSRAENEETDDTPVKSDEPKSVAESGEVGDEELTLSVEKEPELLTVPLLADFTPMSEINEELKAEGLLSPETKPFDLAAFFTRLIGTSYYDLESAYREETGEEWNLYSESGTRWLLSKGYEREALCAMLAARWSDHGTEVARTMRSVRLLRNQPVRGERFLVKKEESEEFVAVELGEYTNEEMMQLMAEGTMKRESVVVSQPEQLPLEPYKIVPLQEFITSLEKSEETDEYGNPYYEIMVDYVGLAEALAEQPGRVVNGSMGVGRIKIRVGYQLPAEVLRDAGAGWLGDEYAGSGRAVDGEMVTFGVPAIAIESPYLDELNIEVMKSFCAMLADENKVVVMATGDSAVEAETLDLPENCVMVGAWDSTGGDKPAHGFRSSEVFYVDHSNVTGGSEPFSSLSTAMVSERLTQAGVAGVDETRALLAEHSRTQIETGFQVLDIGSVANLPGSDRWNDPEVYRKN